jgi:pimeloyl-ACP methyl ester carboxylesterase
VNGIRLIWGSLAGLCGSSLVGVRDAGAQSRCGMAPVGDHRLHYCVTGTGKPAVVLEAGMREHARTWRNVLPELSALTTVITYDSAGMGQSDVGPAPRTSGRVASELRLLLDRVGVQPPYVLVGHSIGGRHVRTLAGNFPEPFAGIVLLDSPHERFEEERLGLLTPVERRERDQTLVANRANLPVPIQLEYEGIAVSEPPPSLPAVPLIVVAAGRHRWEPVATSDDHERLWQAGQRALAEGSPSGRYVLLEDAGHNLHLERPDAVGIIINGLVRMIRMQ